MANNNLFNEIQTLISSLEKAGVNTSKFKDKLKEAGTEEKKLVELMDSLVNKLDNAENSASSLFKSMEAIADELGRSNQTLTRTKGLYGKLTDDARKLRDDEQGITDLNKKQLLAIQKRSKSNFQYLKDQLRSLEEQKQELSNRTDLSEKEEDRLAQLEAAVKMAKDEGGFVRKSLQQTQDRLEQEKRISKQMGVTGAVVGGTGALMERLGMRSGIFKDAVEDAQESMRLIAKQADNIGKKASKIEIAFTGISKLAKGFGEALFDPAVVGGKILDIFFKINKQSVEISRLTGQTGSGFDYLNLGASSAIDKMEVVAELTKQTGLNAQNAFSPSVIAGAADLKVEMGLAAGEAGNLALMAQTSNTSVEALTDTIVDTTSAFNGANKAAVSQGQVMRDVANVSEGIRASFAGNTQELVKGAAAARKLGMDIKRLDDIAGSLLDFESSIGNELEAQLLTGKQLNLAKAREFALSNDLAGLGEELFGNAAKLTEFSSMNRIQQESYAKALGMSRDELARTAYQQALLSGMTQEQAAAAAKVNAEDMRRIDIQENFMKAIEKVAAALTPILDFVGNLVSIPWVPQILLGAVGVTKLVKAFKSFTILQKLSLKNMDLLNIKTKLFGKMYKGGQFIPGGGRAKAGGQRAGGLLSSLFGKKGTPTVPQGAGESTGKGITGITQAISKIDMKKVLQGAAAMAVVAGSMFIFGKAIQEFEKIEDWGSVAAGLTAFTLALGATAVIASLAAPALYTAAPAILAFGAATFLLGAGIGLASAGLSLFVDSISKLNINSITPLLLLGPALFSIAAGLGAIAFAGIAAIPALAALSGFALAATPLIAISGLFNEKESNKEESAILTKLDEIKTAISEGAVVKLDSDVLFKIQAKAFSKISL
jgi:hypothetical protein